MDRSWLVLVDRSTKITARKRGRGVVMDREVIEELITLRLQGYGSEEMDSEIDVIERTHIAEVIA